MIKKITNKTFEFDILIMKPNKNDFVFMLFTLLVFVSVLDL